MFIKRIFSPPDLNNSPEQQQTAILFHKMLLCAFVVILSSVCLYMFLPGASEQTLPSVALFLTICAISYGLLHAGYVKKAGIFMFGMLWFAITLAAFYEAGSLLYELEYLVLPPALAFLTLGRRWGVTMTIASMSSVLLIGWLTLMGFTTPPPLTDLSTAVVFASIPRLIILASMATFFFIRQKALEKTKALLQISEERNRMVLELMGDAAYLHDSNGIIIDANRQASVLLGYEEKELVGQHVSVVNPERQPDVLPFQIAALQKNKPIRLNDQLITKDKRLLQTDTRIVLMEIGGEQLVFGVTRDVTESIRMQEALLASQKELAELNDRLQLVADNVPVYMSYIDKNEKVIFMNRVFMEIGLEPATSIGKQLSELHPPERYEKLSPNVKRVLQGERLQYDVLAETTDGHSTVNELTYVPHVVDDDVVGYFALGRDVTEERMLENALLNSQSLQQEAADRLRTITDNLPVRIAYLGADKMIQFTNREFQLQHKLDSDELIGKSLKEISPEDLYTSALLPQLESVLNGKEVQFDAEREESGSTKKSIAEVHYVPHFVNEKVVGVFALERDVTEERRREQLTQQSQRLESLGLLAGGIAHDFNNLLVAILGQSSLAAAKLKDDHPATRHVEKAVKASRRASSLTNQMLAYSGQGHFEIRPINFNTLITQNLHLFEASIGRNILLNTNFEEDLPMVEADTAQMQQVIMNLIINAAQAIGTKNGQITLTTDTYQIIEDEQKFWQFTGEPLEPGIFVSIEVQDDGCGMSEEQIAKIFEPFFSTKESGSGLGLSAVLGIVRGHKGGIRVYSEVGKGTVFRMLIPVENSAEINRQLEPENTPTFMRGLLPNSVLVIDDERHVAEGISDMLDAAGFNTLIAYSGKEGVRLYQENIDDIALVVLDLVMPEMDGERVYEELRSVDPYANILLTSGYNRGEAMRQFIGKELAGFIQKPYTPQMLVSELERLLPTQSTLSA